MNFKKWKTPLTTMHFSAVCISRSIPACVFSLRSLHSHCQAPQHNQHHQKPSSVLSNSYPSTFPNGLGPLCPKPYDLISSGLQDKFLHTSPNAGTQLRQSFRKSLFGWKYMQIDTDGTGYTWKRNTIGSVWATNKPHGITTAGWALWSAVLSVWNGL